MLSPGYYTETPRILDQLVPPVALLLLRRQSMHIKQEAEWASELVMAYDCEGNISSYNHCA
jgi:hypothetical protein